LICLHFVGIFQHVIRPRRGSAGMGVCQAVCGASRAARRGVLVALLGAVGWGCREAQTPTGPPPQGPTPAISLEYIPARDTLVDSVGILNIDVTARSQSFIDSVALVLEGAPLAIPTAYPLDTVFHALYPVPLGSLHHRPFSFAVAAADIMGHDTTTPSVTVRVR
jgi:hypothetical protein